MMRTRSLMLKLVPVLLLAVATSAQAVINLSANLTNAGEPSLVVPTTSTGQPRPASFGTATLVINDAQTAMTMSVTVNNIDFTGSQTADTFDNLTAAHIHASATVTPTTNAGVVWGFFGAPFNDNNPSDVVVTPFASGVGGTITGKWDAPEGNNTTLAAQIPNLTSVHAYLNFHTVQFGGGEIRGMIVPEPATLGVFGIGATLLLIRRRRAA
jgi:hypothetical protein